MVAAFPVRVPSGTYFLIFSASQYPKGYHELTRVERSTTQRRSKKAALGAGARSVASRSTVRKVVQQGGPSSAGRSRLTLGCSLPRQKWLDYEAKLHDPVPLLIHGPSP